VSTGVTGVFAALTVVMYSATRSQGLLAICVLSWAHWLIAVAYNRRVRRRDTNPATLTRFKYELILRLLATTWYFWLGVTTYIMQARGYAVFEALFNDDTTDDLTARSRNAVTGLFVVTAASVLVDAYVAIFHTRAVRASNNPTEAAAALQKRPSIALLLTAGIDVVMVAFTGWAYAVSNSAHGLIATIVVALVSFVCEAYFAREAATRPYVDEGFHVAGQLLALQHIFLVSTVFLVNLLVLLLESVGYTFTTALDGSAAGLQTVVALAIGSYVVFVLTTVALVSLHSQLETSAHAHDLDAIASASGHVVVVAPPAGGLSQPSYFAVEEWGSAGSDALGGARNHGHGGMMGGGSVSAGSGSGIGGQQRAFAVAVAPPS
jgi:hypothetical protein